MSKKTITFAIIFIIAAAVGYSIFSTDDAEDQKPAEQLSVHITDQAILDQDGVVLVSQDDVPQSMAVSPDAEFGAAGSFTSAEVSPDNTWIAFTTSGAAHGGGWLYEVQSGEVTAAAFQYGGDVQALEWSPDGEYALFSVSTPAPTKQLVLVDRDNLTTYVEDTSTTVSVSAAAGMNPPASYEFERWEAPQTLCFNVLDSEHCVDAADMVAQTGDETQTDESAERTVQLYYYSAEQDTDDQGNVMCSAEGLASVERSISEIQTPLTRSVELLLAGDITAEEEAAGMTTEFPLDGFSLESASIENGVATLEFADPQNSSSGGSCRVSILRAQIGATATQFDSVDSVQIIPEEILQP